jgi:hypothetical protein
MGNGQDGMQILLIPHQVPASLSPVAVTLQTTSLVPPEFQWGLQ